MNKKIERHKTKPEGHPLTRTARCVMQHGHRFTVLSVIAVCSMLLLITADAGAQPESASPPPLPQPGSAPNQPVWISIAISFLLFAAIMFVSLRQGKRGHQD